MLSNHPTVTCLSCKPCSSNVRATAPPKCAARSRHSSNKVAWPNGLSCASIAGPRITADIPLELSSRNCATGVSTLPLIKKQMPLPNLSSLLLNLKGRPRAWSVPGSCERCHRQARLAYLAVYRPVVCRPGHTDHRPGHHMLADARRRPVGVVRPPPGPRANDTRPRPQTSYSHPCASPVNDCVVVTTGMHDEPVVADEEGNGRDA